MLIDLGTRVSEHDWVGRMVIYGHPVTGIPESFGRLPGLPGKRPDSLSGYSDYHSPCHEVKGRPDMKSKCYFPPENQTGRMIKR